MRLTIPRVALVTLLLVMLVQPACHLIFPFNAATETDSSVDAPGDTATNPPPDALPDTLPEISVDTAPDTAPPPDTTPSPDTLCETPSINQNATNCAGQSIAPSGDADKDGMLDGRDPAVTACNKVLFVDDFKVAPSLSKWKTTNTTSTCGKLELMSGGYLQLASPALLPAGGPYLVEVKFTFNTPSVSTDWQVGIQNGLTSGIKYQCEVFINAKKGVLSPSLHHIRNNCSQNTDFIETKKPILDTPGTSYTLQSYHDGIRDHCRIVNDGDQIVATGHTNFPGCPTSTPDTFKIFNFGRAVTLDWVHVFRM
jgi:hypothetical protein